MRYLLVLAVGALVPQAVWAQPREPYQVGTENTRLVDASRQREIGSSLLPETQVVTMADATSSLARWARPFLRPGGRTPVPVRAVHTDEGEGPNRPRTSDPCSTTF